ncbi:dihydroorotase [Pedobacter yulinensis]|uniref:Dihydroorotase n=1 Tax=Pedobacter yulinensis TaxID=2126353 RepID=A0A2T3HHB8_9SPHI|nr:dihydroorotase [Pedobacter yulinensis]PST81793.1 dihydroorotase [Pedobacter yulinensis]
MNLLLKNVIITDPGNTYNGQKADLRIENGQITAIGELTKTDGEQEIDGKGGFLSAGFFDLNAAAGDPGFETREDIDSLIAAARAGGFTGVAVMPHTAPVVQSKSQVQYICNKARGGVTDIHPVGALSLEREGKELAELYDMRQAGAIAFSDGDRPVKDDGFMSRALQYLKGFDGLLMVYPENGSIAGKAKINESANSVLLGMKGLPALAEEMQISRDIFLAAYNEARVHISTVSAAGSVALIRKAKQEGVNITCDVAAHHLSMTEELLADFDSNYKVKPPLRGAADVAALLEGLKDGTIDAVCSQHRPEEIEFKNVEFEIAHYGIIGLQTVLPLLVRAGLGAVQIAEKLAAGPRKVLGIPVPAVSVGTNACLTLFNTTEKWRYDEDNNYSLSANSPLLGQELTGRVQLIFNNNQLYTNG